MGQAPCCVLAHSLHAARRTPRVSGHSGCLRRPAFAAVVRACAERSACAMCGIALCAPTPRPPEASHRIPPQAGSLATTLVIRAPACSRVLLVVAYSVAVALGGRGRLAGFSFFDCAAAARSACCSLLTALDPRGRLHPRSFPLGVPARRRVGGRLCERAAGWLCSLYLISPPPCAPPAICL